MQDEKLRKLAQNQTTHVFLILQKEKMMPWVKTQTPTRKTKLLLDVTRWGTFKKSQVNLQEESLQFNDASQALDLLLESQIQKMK